MNVIDLLTREYEQMDTWSSGKNEPKTNPNEPKTNPILANKTPIRTQSNPILVRHQRGGTEEKNAAGSPAKETNWHLAGSGLYSQKLCLKKY